jgi:protein TonB
VNSLTLKFDGAGFALAILIHASALLYVYLAPPLKTKRVTTIEVDVRKPKPPPPPAPPPEPPPEPPPPPPPPEPPKVVKKQPRPAEAPRTNQPPPAEPPKEPPKPVFGIDPSQTGGDGISVPVGNTTMADPSKRPKVAVVPPLPPVSSAPAGKEYVPVAEEQLKKLPEHDNEECGAAMKQKWSESEANAAGLTGDVILRIELDERGKWRSYKVIKGINNEVNAMAVGFLRFDPRCRFRPAQAKDGKAVAFVIERYVVHFERE